MISSLDNTPLSFCRGHAEGRIPGSSFDNAGTTEFRGINREIKLDSQVLIKVALM
jgi:hypothetical protein